MGLLYTNAKIFHHKEKLDSLSKAKSDILAPLHIRIKPTNTCNHNCWYCAYRKDDLQLGKDMNKRDSIPREKMIEIIEDIIDMDVLAVTFSGGGDPFFYPYLTEAVHMLAKSSVKFASLTNGSRLDGELAEIFSHRASWLRISIDGWDDKSYAAYRNVPEGEFTKIMGNLKKFKKLGGPCYLGISLVVDTKNAFHLYDFIKRLKDIGVDSVKVGPCIPYDDIKKNNDYHRPVFEKVKNSTKKAMRDFADNNFEIYDSYHLVEEKFNKDYHWCPYLQILPVIGADLNIYPCQDKAYNAQRLVGTIKEQRFKKFWFSDKSKFFRLDPSIHCNNHCVANAKNKLVLEYLDADSGHIGFV